MAPTVAFFGAVTVDTLVPHDDLGVGCSGAEDNGETDTDDRRRVVVGSDAAEIDDDVDCEVVRDGACEVCDNTEVCVGCDLQDDTDAGVGCEASEDCDEGVGSEQATKCATCLKSLTMSDCKYWKRCFS